MKSAARTNLTSDNVRISNKKLGEGTFRVCLAGTYIGGTRNQQEAACKRFKPEHRDLALEYFAKDFQIIDMVLLYAETWNLIVPRGKEIMVNRGSIIHSNSGIAYLAEPLIRYYTKFTSNSGWIDDTSNWEVRAMAAFSHFTYAWSGGQYIVRDLQGRYRSNRYNPKKSRFELTDPAICSRRRSFGPTDLGEKGIDSFFHNHECNEFCENDWKRPRNPRQWYPHTRGTSMISSQVTHKLTLGNRATFRLNLRGVMEEEDDYDDSEDSSEDSY
jgi:Alpha-kinase family